MRNTNGRFPHDLNGINRVEIVGWPGGEGNAVVVEDKEVRGIVIEVDVADGEHWTYSKEKLPKLIVWCNRRPRAERRMVVLVALGKKSLVHFVQR